MWSRGNLLPTLLLLACLAAVGRAQSNTQGGSECEAVQAQVGDLRRIVLDAAVLKMIKNDLQILANCIPANGVLKLSVSRLPLEDIFKIKRPITIEGNGASVQCLNDQREGAFKIRSDDVTISNLVFKGCNFNSTVGLVDVKSSRNVTLQEVRFVENNNVAGPGCISVIQSEVELSKVEARNNTGILGGVLHAEANSKIAIIDSVFSENEALDKGGAMYLHDSNANVVDSTFEKNTAFLKGGAIFAQGVLDFNLMLENVTFRGNEAEGEGFLGEIYSAGGGVALMGPKVKADIRKTKFIRNFAFSGGGLSLVNGTAISIFDSQFIHNSGVLYGGAISAEGDALIKTSDVEFKHNSVEGAGGALFLLGGNLEMEGGLCQNNSVVLDGGAIYLAQEGTVPTATITSGSFIANKASRGGAIYLQTGNLTTSHCNFQNNVVYNGGGALYCEDLGLNVILARRDSFVNVLSSNFSGNQAGDYIQGKRGIEITSLNGKGGAFLMTGLGLISKFKDCNFSNNAAGSGGAGHVLDVKEFTLEDSYFWMGSALVGGALTAINAGKSFVANNVRFFKNGARWGGALSFTLSDAIRLDGFVGGSVSLTQAHFVENVATRGGGAVNVEGRSLECTSCLFDSNSAGVNGGALRGLSESSITLVNSTITDCTAANSGGGIAVEDAVFQGENVTITNNTAIKNGGGFVVRFGAFAGKQVDPWRCKSCRIQENKAAAGGGIHVLMEVLAAQDCSALEGISSVERQNQRFELLADCNDVLDESDSLRPRVLLESSRFEGNVAEVSGSHIFLANVDSTMCCDDHCWNGKRVWEAVQKCGLSDMPTADEKSTSLLGTSFDSLVVVPFQVTGHPSGNELPAIAVTSLDALDQIAVANVSLKMRVHTPGAELFGSPIIREGVLLSGDMNVTGVFMRALPGNYSLFFELTSEDRIVTHSLAVEIRHCVIGEISREDGLRCDECPDDSFSFDVTDENCTPCPVEKARCSGGTLAPLDGFWHSGPRTSQVHACLSEESCTYPHRTNMLFASSLNSSEDYPQCAKGYRDVLCGSCDASHGRSRFKCTECRGKVPAGFGIVVVMLALAVLSLIYVKSAATHSREVLGKQPNTSSLGSHGLNLQGLVLGEIAGRREELAHPNVHQNTPQRKTRASDIFKILVNFFQVAGSAAAINVGWTESMLAIFTTWDVVSGVADSNSFFSLDCAFSSGRNGVPRSIQTSAFLAIVPFMVWAALVIVHYGSAVKSKKSFQDVKVWSSIALLAVLQASYISMTRTLARIFNCVDVSPMEGLFWVQDTSVDCYKGSHAFLVGLVGASGLLLISIGFPGWLLFKLTRSTESLESEEMIVQYGFLYRAYKKNVAAWEVVILLRKASLAAIVVFGRTLAEGIQGNLALFILMGSIILQMYFQPFLEPKVNLLEVGSLAISTCAFIIGNLVDQPRMSDGGRVALSIVLVGVMLIYFVYMLKQIFDVASLELRGWMQKENLGGQLPTNNFGLFIVVAKSRIKKMKESLRKSAL